MDYNESLKYLFSQLPMFSRVGAPAYKPGLQTSERLDSFFGHPHRRFKSIHVAGTNGKGSTAHTLAAILQAQGYKTALYTSPHLTDFRERMRINGDMIPADSVADFVNRFRASDYDGHPSFFELTMMMAFDWFASEHVDYAVIEVGMGGRLDSTNIISPIACVITNISADHTQFLGSSLPQIAAEKAGIIKRSVPVTIGEAEGEVREVFAHKAAEMGADITFATESPLLIESSEDPAGGRHCVTATGLEFRFPLAGDYQVHNINTVLHAVEMLRHEGVHIGDKALIRGLEGVTQLTGLRGRWMHIADSPLTIADTGHNEAGLISNMQQLQTLMSQRPEGARLHMVMGFVADKDIDKILSLLPKDAYYYFTQASIPRALDVNELIQYAAAAGLRGEAVTPVKEAVSQATRQASPQDVIYIGGSTFVVADYLE